VPRFREEQLSLDERAGGGRERAGKCEWDAHGAADYQPHYAERHQRNGKSDRKNDPFDSKS
jgi:hypothetical protein